MRVSNFSVFCCLVVTTLASDFALAGDYQFDAFVNRNHTLDGTISYDIQISLSDSRADGEVPQLSLIAPNGRRFDNLGGPLVLVIANARGIPVDELDTTWAGTWMFEETLPGSATDVYEFDVLEMQDSNQFVTPPLITSPEDGESVPPVFDLEWENFDDGCSISWDSFFGFFDRPNISCRDDGVAVFDFSQVDDFDGAEANQLTVQRKRFDSTAVSQFIPLTPSAASSFTRVGMEFNSVSPAIDFAVVPEPSASFSMRALLLMLIFCFRSKSD